MPNPVEAKLNEFDKFVIDSRYDRDRALEDVAGRREYREYKKEHKKQERRKAGLGIARLLAVSGAITTSAVLMAHTTLGEGVRAFFNDQPATSQPHPKNVEQTDQNGTITGAVSFEHATPAQQAEAEYMKSGELAP